MLKFSCVLSIALFFVWLILVGVLFGVLDGAGVIHKINDAYTTIQGGNAKPPVLLPDQKQSRKKLTIACEPMVSSLTEVAKLLQPGRCVT